MTTPYTENLTEDGTYWSPGVPDGFGGTTYNAPTAIRIRWQDKAVLFRDPQGREVVSDAIVYVSQDVAVAGYLYRGVSVELEPPAEAKEIRQKQASPSLDGNETLYKAML